jgi:ribosomal protein L11 methyltransferase
VDTVRLFPALDLTWPSEPTDDDREIAVASVDEFGPTAVEITPSGIRVFFRSLESRDAAARAAAASLPGVSTASTQIPDENWAERSQAAITPIVVGRITVSPPWLAAGPSDTNQFHITILPSMGFGTGHHASTRLCLRLLQKYIVSRTRVLDVGTGSGVLAIAARCLGARQVVAVDTDPDALQNARENVELNGISDVELVHGDIIAPVGFEKGFDMVLANLTGSLLCRTAGALAAAARSGVVIASGYQVHEREGVEAAFGTAGATLDVEHVEGDWVGAAYRVRS